MPPLTYAETSIDYHLCSHPKYKFTKETHSGSSIPLTQKQFLHHTVMLSPGSLAELARATGKGRGHGWRVTAGTETGRFAATAANENGDGGYVHSRTAGLTEVQVGEPHHSGPVHTHLSGSKLPVFSF